MKILSLKFSPFCENECQLFSLLTFFLVVIEHWFNHGTPLKRSNKNYQPRDNKDMAVLP